MRWLFLDRIDEVVIGARITGVKAAAMSEDYFAEHFPNFPVVPGVIVTEALAQLSGKLIELSVFEERGYWPFPILSMVNKAKYRRFVRPGSVIQMTSEVISLRDESAMMKVEARVDGHRIQTAELTFVFNPAELPDDAALIEDLERRFMKQIWPGYGDYLATSRRSASEEQQ